MSLHVQAAPPSHYPWLIERVGCATTPGFRAIEAVDESNRVHAMVGFDNWTETAACMHVALEKPIALRHILRPAFHYLFSQVGRRVALAWVASDNAKAVALDTNLGFRLRARIQDGISAGVDALLLELRREECRFLKEAP